MHRAQAKPAANYLEYIVHATTGVRSGMATGPTTRAAAQQQKLEEHLAVNQEDDVKQLETDSTGVCH